MDMLMRCVASITQSDFTDFEIVIVDDCSTDGTEKRSPSDFNWPATTILHATEQLMMVRARNLGAQHAASPNLIFIDDDNVVPPEMIGQLVRATHAHPDFGILGPVMYFHANRELILCGQRFSFYTGHTRGLPLDLTDSPIIESDGVPNAFLIRKPLFEQIGGFDAAIFQTFTEPDFAFQARRLGWRCGILKEAGIYHDVPTETRFSPRSLGTMYIQKAYCLMRNRTVMVVRYGTFVQRLVYLMCFSWLWPLLYSALMLRHGNTRILAFYWAGFADGWRYALTRKLSPGLPHHLKIE